jgi:hypothetical protein
LQDAAFLVDLAALQEKHVETAKKLLGQGPELTSFVARLMDDIGNLKAMLQAICIGEAFELHLTSFELSWILDRAAGAAVVAR